MQALSTARAAFRAQSRAFSTTPSRADMAKLTLIGRLGKEPELRYTKNNKEYVLYAIATTQPPLPSQEDGVPTTTWHNIFSFQPNSFNYLRSLKRGSLVYAETTFELRQPDPNASPDSHEGQRQIFLRHEAIKVIRSPRPPQEETSEGEE